MPVLPVTWTLPATPSRRSALAAVSVGDRRDHAPVHLFRPGMVNIARSQPGLDMGDRTLAVIGRKRRRHRRHRVALHDHAIDGRLIENVADPRQQPGGQPIEALVRLHQVQIMIGPNANDAEHLIQKPPMLPRHAGRDMHARTTRQRMHHRKQFDGLRPRAENHQNPLPCHGGFIGQVEGLE